jgi:hypothetical protein
MEVQGKLINVLDTQSGKSSNGKEWSKKDFVIQTDAKYNPEICFTLFGTDKINILDNVSIGDEIEVHFNLSSREYNGKYYTQANAWKIEKIANEVEQGEEMPF